MSTLKPGDRCGGNLVVRLIGEGGQSSVYEVITPEGDRRAQKVLAADAALSSTYAARFGQEAEALATIVHLNILRFHGTGIDAGRVWLLVELVEGESLYDRLDLHRERTHARILVSCQPPPRRPPSLEDLLRWLIQACEGVAAAHDAGVVHRDLKPENLLITPDGVVKVIDFGFAKLATLGVRTTAGKLVGTPHYAPPEQLRRPPSPPHPSWDVYALGLVLYEALAGAHPTSAPDRNPYQACHHHLTHHPSPLAHVVSGLPSDLTDLVDLAIHPIPSARPTMRDFAAKLHAVLQRLLVAQRTAARNLPLPKRDLAAAPTVPLPVYAPEPGDRPALPPPPSTAPARIARASAPATTVALPVSPAPAPEPTYAAAIAGRASAAIAGRASATSAHDVSAAPVETVARAPRARRGPAAGAAIAVLLLFLVAGVWGWRARVAGTGGIASPAAGAPPETAAPALAPPRASSTAAASAPVAAPSAAPAPLRPGAAPPARRKTKGSEARP